MIVGVTSPPHVFCLRCGEGRTCLSIKVCPAPSQRMCAGIVGLVLAYPAHLNGVDFTEFIFSALEREKGVSSAFPSQKQEVI